MNDLTEVQILERKYKFIEQAQSSIIASGGSFMTKAAIERMTVGEFLGLTIPNLVVTEVKYDSEEYIKIQARTGIAIKGVR